MADATRWLVGDAVQARRLQTRLLLQAQAVPATAWSYSNVLTQRDRSSASLAVDAQGVVGARVIQPPPPPPPRTLVPTSTRGPLSPEAVFVGIVFG